MVANFWDCVYQWVLQQSHEAGFRDPLMWFLAIFIAAHGCWLYFGTVWNEIWVQRMTKRAKYLRNEAPWPRSWWHHPRDQWSPLLGHVFSLAMLFELWWLATWFHGKNVAKKSKG